VGCAEAKTVKQLSPSIKRCNAGQVRMSLNAKTAARSLDIHLYRTLSRRHSCTVGLYSLYHGMCLSPDDHSRVVDVKRISSLCTPGAHPPALGEAIVSRKLRLECRSTEIHEG
jgi:hypothetical protein